MGITILLPAIYTNKGNEEISVDFFPNQSHNCIGGERMAKKKRVLICCATTVATSSVMLDRIKRISEEEDLEVELFKTSSTEVEDKTKTLKPDLVVSTVQIQSDLKTPILSGVPYISGVGAKELDEKILEILKEE